MKRILATAILAMSVSVAWAQAPAPEKEAAQGTPSQAEAPKAAASEGAAKAVVARKPNPRRFEDARHCLDKGTNLEIIKCAEAYL